MSGSGSFSGEKNATGSSEMSDPRVSGDWAITQDLHCDPAAGFTCAKWGQATLTNDGGAWEGEWTGLHHPGGTRLGRHYITTWLSGTGDYEGLIYARIGDVDLTGTGSLTGSLIAGGNVNSGSGTSGSGQSLALTNKVDGSTSGNLTLRQNLTGGDETYRA